MAGLMLQGSPRGFVDNCSCGQISVTEIVRKRKQSVRKRLGKKQASWLRDRRRSKKQGHESEDEDEVTERQQQ
jgi:hypothetical protein